MKNPIQFLFYLYFLVVFATSCKKENNGSTPPVLSRWEKVNCNLNGFIVPVTSTGSNLFTGTWSPIGVFYNSTDHGTTWNIDTSGLMGNYNVYTFYQIGNKVFAGMVNSLFVSENNGQTWSTDTVGLTNHPLISSVAQNDNTIFLGTSNGVYLSTNQGKSWFTNSPGFTYLVSALAINGNNLFVGTEPNGIFLSTDNGKNWTPINNGINQTGKYSVNSFFVNGVEIYTAANGKIYVSNNYGTSWTADTSGLMGYDATSIIMLDNKLLAGTINGVYVSSPNGGSWSADTTGLPYLTAVLSMTYDNYYVYIGTFNIAIVPGSTISAIYRRSRSSL